ncbi:MAG: DUF2341 domain-containing protein [Chitinispirillaceae bacterium]|nr:DUF2341 domain-containing protein [Chitinispirillaceae bacterium]
MSFRTNAFSGIFAKKAIFPFFIGIVCFFAPDKAQAAEDYSSWTNHLKVTINTTGLGLTQDVANFPVLVRINPSAFAGMNDHGGADIRFSEANYGNHLPYEIEYWSGTEAHIWVRVNTVYQNNATQYIVLHYGSSNGTQSNGNQVFNPAAAGFGGVWHLHYNANDATNGYNASFVGTSDTVGIIGRARKLNPVTPEYVYVNGLMSNPTQITFSCWVKVDSLDPAAGTDKFSTLIAIGNDVALVDKGDGPPATRDSLVSYTSANWYAAVQPGSTTNMLKQGWKYVAATFNYASENMTQTVYLNGTQVATRTNTGILTWNNGAGNTYFGHGGLNNNNYDLGGCLDEVRIDKAVRSASYLKLCYETQKPGASVLTYTPIITDNENYADWPYNQRIYINTSSSGVEIPSNVYNFPLLIRLNPSNFASFSQTLSGGADIRFSKANGTHLPYEIERWVDGASNNDTAVIWVRMDTVLGQSANQYITIHWGKSDAASRSNGQAVFDAAAGYQGAWHLAESPGGTNTILDRTANANHGSPQNSLASDDLINGIIGRGLNFDGPAGDNQSGDYAQLPNSTSLDNTGDMTISCWFRMSNGTSSGATGYYGFAGKISGTSPTYNGYTLVRYSDQRLRFMVAANNSGTVINSNAVVTDNNWHHIAGTMASGTMNLYVDGVQQTETASSVSITASGNYGTIGRQYGDYNGRHFLGDLDEVQIARTSRSQYWIKLAYETQRQNVSVICYPATISAHPQNAQVDLGDSASFSVTALGNNISYQWQRRPGGSSTWSNVTTGTGQTAATYKFRTAETDTNSSYRCIVSSCFTSDTSTAAVLTVCIPLVITTQPQPATITVGDTATFSVAATGKDLTWQWQRSTGGGAWGNVTIGVGATAATYKFRTDSSDTNRRFRCVLTGICGSRDTTQAAALTLCYLVIIRTQPANQSVTAGQDASFSVVAGGKELSYQWQRRDFGSSSWLNVSGANAANYSFTTLTPAVDSSRAPDSGASFRCVISSPCGSATSSAAQLSVCAPPVIRTQPRDTNAQVGTEATFRVVAVGTGLAYQWQRTSDGGTTWSNITGATSSVYTFTTAASDTGSQVQFRCVVSGTCGSVNSTIARIGVCFPPQITDHPDTVNVTSGQQATFTVAASGTGLTYYWQRQNRGASTWDSIKTPTPAIAATYAFNVASADSGALFRCLVGGTCGSAVSNPALLRVCTPVDTAGGPRDTTIRGGDTARFSITVTGTAPTFQWQRSRDNGTSWLDISGATSSRLLFVSDTADTQTLYRCVVGGQCGNVTSRGARLTLCYDPVITQHPADAINIAPDQQVTFSVRAGALPVSYQWEKSIDGGASFAAIDGATGSDFSLIAQPSDNESKFRCRVSSRCDSVVYSNTATLTVCAQPVVVQNPSDRSVIEGQVASFSIQATGTNLSYQWIRRLGGSYVWDTISGAIDTFYSITTVTSDNSSQFRCVVNGSCGTCTSSVAILTVYQKARAYFRMSDSIGPVPFEVRFTDSSSGTISSWVWSFGDGTVDSATTPENKVHIYDSAAVYTVRLTVSGPGGIDSMTRTVTAYPPTGNPIVIAGRYLRPDAAELVLRNYGGLRSEFPPPFVSAIRLWNRVNALPADTATAAILKTYDLAALKARGSEYRDTATVTALAPPDSTYGFMTQIVWNDGRTSPFAALNGFLVLMRDTVKPVNNLVLAGRYAPRDTVFFTIDSTQTIDTAKADSMALWFGLGSDSTPNFTTRTNVTWWPAGAVLGGSSNGRFTHVVKSDQFNTDRKTLYCAVMLLGKNKQRSLLKTARFTIGRVRPANPVVLHALALNANSIRLSWNTLDPDSVQQVRIYYRTGNALPLEYDFSAVSPKDSVFPAPAVSDTADTVYRLNETTRYYFAAQIYFDGMWSRVTQISSATDSTGEADSSTIINSVTITGLAFDTTTNRVRINWEVDTVVGSNLQVGISYAVDQAPPQDTAIDQVVEVVAAGDSAEIDMGEALLFDTTFTFYLWLKKTGEKWARPTDKSTDTLHIPPFVWQAVRYSVRYLEDDTTRWVNGRIRFATNKVLSQNEARNYVGKIHRFDADSAALHGFVVVGQSFLFTEKESSVPIEIGLKCYNLPSAFALSDVRMYRWNGTYWMVDRSTAFDTAASIVHIRTNELDEPFAAMVDTLQPAVTVCNQKKEVLERGEEVSDTIAVSDNIGNCLWSFRCIEGDKSIASSDTSQQQTMSAGRDTARVVISGTLVSEENGVRALFIASDDRFSDTTILSRRVIRERSDVLPITREMHWTPLRVTAELDSPGVGRLWRMVDTASSNPKYDKVKVRLFRWYPYSGNRDEDKKWVEYGSGRDSIFAFYAGRLFWVKLREGATFDWGRGLTMPLHDTVTIALNGGGWTDFALPYRFNMRVGDIIAATRRNVDYADSLQFYRWDTSGSTYKCTPFYLKEMAADGLDNPAAELSSRDLAGYTVYNPHSEAITLRVPPVPVAMSTITGTPKQAHERGWMIKLVPHEEDGSRLNPVYCGCMQDKAPGVRYFPQPPSFSDLGAGVYDEKSGRIYGHKVQHGMSDGGCAYLLVFTNRTEAPRTIRCFLDRGAGFPSDRGTAIYDPVTGTIESGDATEFLVPVAGQGQEYRWLFAGTAAFISSAARKWNAGVLGFGAPYPNPLRGFVHLRYSLPFGSVSRVDFMAVDIRGRIVWQKTIPEKSVIGGNRECLWNGTTTRGTRLAAGLYVIKMTAYDLKHKSVGSFEQRITVLR